MRIERSCLGGRAAKMINSRCASELLLSVGFREMISDEERQERGRCVSEGQQDHLPTLSCRPSALRLEAVAFRLEAICS